MIIAPLRFSAALEVAEKMREADKREIYAMRWNESPAEVARDCALAGSFAWIAGLERPIAAIGATPLHPGVWSAWCFGTDEFPQIGYRLTRFVQRVMMPALVECGAHRAEAWSIEGHTEAQRWLELLGARRECTRQGFGKHGQDFHCYAWT